MLEGHDLFSPGGGYSDDNGEVFRHGIILNRQGFSIRQLACGCSLGETMERHRCLARRCEDCDLQAFDEFADVGNALFACRSDLVRVAKESNAGGTNRRNDHERILSALYFREALDQFNQGPVSKSTWNGQVTRFCYVNIRRLR